MSLPTATAPSVSIDSGNAAKIYLKNGSSPTASEVVPTLSNLQVQLNGQTETIPIHDDDGWDRAIKTGINGTISFETLAPKSNAVVAEILAAAHSVGDSANLLCIIESPDGRYLSGQVVVDSANPMTPTRGAFRYSVQLTTDGKLTAS